MITVAHFLLMTVVKSVSVLINECVYVLRRAALLVRVVRQRGARK